MRDRRFARRLRQRQNIVTIGHRHGDIGLRSGGTNA
jgi:hypothetical protein